MGVMKFFCSMLTLTLIAGSGWASDATLIQQTAPNYDAGLDRIFARENQFVQTMRHYTPLVETYIQQPRRDNDLGEVPNSDRYFIGRLLMTDRITDQVIREEIALHFARSGNGHRHVQTRLPAARLHAAYLPG
jgi:hypothetical protein